MSKRVVITGRGTVTAFGESWDENKTKICELKNAVRHMQIVAGDNGIAAVTPHGVFKSCGFILPRDVWYVCSDYFCHI